MSKAFAGRYALALGSRGGIRRLLRAHSPLRLFDVAIREAWESLGMRILRLLGRSPSRGYGWFEALLSPTCDYWLRYAQVVDALNTLARAEPIRMVEVASGGRGGISWTAPGKNIKACLVDWAPDLIRDWRGGDAWRVCADGSRLPFSDESFDVAITVDTVEHLPRSVRPVLIEELKRVTKRALLVTCPLQSDDGVFKGRDFDLQLRREIESRNGAQPGWLREHLQEGHPTRDELSRLLPGAEITGSENCDVWLRFALLYQRKFLWIFSALFYVFALQKNDRFPPYRRALLVWQKPRSMSSEAISTAEHGCATTPIV